ncbi:MAG: amidohydrolase family protein, partial [Candidatus Bathyarchaeia archaeon]
GMIVDVHTHIPRFRKPVRDEEAVYETRFRPHDSPVKMSVSWEEHYAAMAPVDKAIVFGIAMKGENPNDAVAEYVRSHPDKLVGFLSVDPKDPKALEELDRSVFQLGLKGIKLGPMYQGFHPWDERAFAIYKRAQDLGLPILFHQATSPGREDPLEYAHPRLIEKVALAFRDLKMVIAHMGHPWERDTIVLIRKQPNVYADISALFYRPWQFYNTLVLCHEYGQMEKLLFGSDYPVTTPGESLSRIRKVNALVEGTKLPRVPEEEIEGIIHRDALKVLGIKL